MSAPWTEGRVYQVKLGSSFTKPGPSTFHTLQYSFKPASLENGGRGNIDFSGSQVSMEVTPTSGGVPVQFKGTCSDAKEGECVLIWEDGSFRLEKLASTAKALRAVSTTQRSATAKRPRTPGQRTPAIPRKAQSSSALLLDAEKESNNSKESKLLKDVEEELDEAGVDAELEGLLAAD